MSDYNFTPLNRDRDYNPNDLDEDEKVTPERLENWKKEEVQGKAKEIVSIGEE